ncbi:MAG: 5-(carboxyamino)imidazole ribonucleotide synthase [Bdellovibrionota bacterium]
MSIHKKTIGILGGGQLARMLVLKAHQMGLSTVVLAEKLSDPAVQIANSWIKSSISSNQSIKDIRKLMLICDVITFESEFISAELLKKALKGRKSTKILPSLECLGRIQDRLKQKEWLWDYELPTLDHVKINSREDIDLAFKAFDQKVVFKKRTGGYDGYGTFVIKSLTELSAFKKSIKNEEFNYIIEPFIQFKSEKSLIFARNTLGQTVSFPMIQSVQKNNQCDYVFGPVTHAAEKNLKNKIIKFLNQINYVGTIAFELFDLGNKLVINEIAPRVHNTGHFSQDALSIDQFELHLRCVLGMNLPEIEMKQPAFVMVNLLGLSTRIPTIKKFPTGAFHWYNKTENRPRRKMGHVNYIGRSKQKILKKALLERKGILL